jgi:hypothetical protein
MTKNRIRGISTCDFEGGLGVVQVSRGEVREYLPGNVSVGRLGRACEELVHAGHGAMIPDPCAPLAWFLTVFSKEARSERCPF